MKEIINKIKNELNNIDKKTFNKKVDEIAASVREDNIVIIYGYSDDIVEFDGAIIEELDCYGAADFFIDYIDRHCYYLFPQDFVDHATEYINSDYEDTLPLIDELLQEHIKKIIKLKAAYCGKFNKDGWGFELELPESTKIDYDTFNVLEDGEVFIKGLIIDLESFKKAEAEYEMRSL